jgi:CRP/FNR family transcriptional regulator, cyclic AMP receptor protein
MALAITGEVLHRIPLLSGMNESEFHQIADVARVRTFAAGDYVIRQGDQSRDLWIVLEGECEVARRLAPNGQSSNHQDAIVLAVLQPYTHFGEMSFFHPAPHSADVRARSPLKLLQITHADYADMIQDGIWAAFKLAYNVVQQLAERLRRMDEWVAELANNPYAAANVPEWSRFRSKVFDGWTL